MKKRIVIPIICCMVVMMTGCGSQAPKDSASSAEPGSVIEAEQISSSSDEEKTPEAKPADNNEALTEEQALEAVKAYCISQNPELENELKSNEHTVYFDVNTNDAGEIVVLYRSYTGSENRYYIDPVSGDAYVTELVPGIIDEEQRTEERMNVREYLAK